MTEEEKTQQKKLNTHLQPLLHIPREIVVPHIRVPHVFEVQRAVGVRLNIPCGLPERLRGLADSKVVVRILERAGDLAGGEAGGGAGFGA